MAAGSSLAEFPFTQWRNVIIFISPSASEASVTQSKSILHVAAQEKPIALQRRTEERCIRSPWHLTAEHKIILWAPEQLSLPLRFRSIPL